MKAERARVIAVDATSSGDPLRVLSLSLPRSGGRRRRWTSLGWAAAAAKQTPRIGRRGSRLRRSRGAPPPGRTGGTPASPRDDDSLYSPDVVSASTISRSDTNVGSVSVVEVGEEGEREGEQPQPLVRAGLAVAGDGGDGEELGGAPLCYAYSGIKKVLKQMTT